MEFILNLIPKYYYNRDCSHGVDHIIKAYNNVQVILNLEKVNDDYQKLICLTAIILHDAYDHKYVSDFNQVEDIKQDIRNDLDSIGIFSNDSIELVLNIIDNVSFSKEYRLRRNNDYVDMGENQYLLEIVRDADRLEALGEIGVIRMIQYMKEMKPTCSIEEHVEHIREHCQYKIYNLIEKNYIKTESGRMLARPLMLELVNIVENDDLLIEKIKKYS